MKHFYEAPQFGENWFNYGELYSQIVDYFPSGSKFVEVGSWKGRSSAYMAVEIINAEKNIEFYCVDTWEGGEDHKNDETFSKELETLYEVFLKNISPVKDYIRPIKSTSIEASKQFEDNSLDFIFIDASHEYEDVKNDIKVWLPKVKPGGVFAGHDYFYEGEDYFPGVKRAVNESLTNFQTCFKNCFVYSKPEI